MVRVGIDDLGGKVVWIVGPNLSRHYYAHLNDYADQIQEGDWVEVGEVIGYVGNTGNAKSTPPHLHYGIYLNGQGAVNPYPYLTPSS
ncbi:L-Ala--D-Glu endopeptidase precursor [compost metagenome]